MPNPAKSETRKGTFPTGDGRRDIVNGHRGLGDLAAPRTDPNGGGSPANKSETPRDPLTGRSIFPPRTDA